MIAQKSIQNRAGIAALFAACIVAPSLAMAGIGVNIDLGLGGPAYVAPPPPEYIAPAYAPAPVYGPEYVPDYYDYHHRPPVRVIHRGPPPRHDDHRGHR